MLCICSKPSSDFSYCPMSKLVSYRARCGLPHTQLDLSCTTLSQSCHTGCNELSDPWASGPLHWLFCCLRCLSSSPCLSCQWGQVFLSLFISVSPVFKIVPIAQLELNKYFMNKEMSQLCVWRAHSGSDGLGWPWCGHMVCRVPARKLWPLSVPHWCRGGEGLGESVEVESVGLGNWLDMAGREVVTVTWWPHGW